MFGGRTKKFFIYGHACQAALTWKFILFMTPQRAPTDQKHHANKVKLGVCGGRLIDNRKIGSGRQQWEVRFLTGLHSLGIWTENRAGETAEVFRRCRTDSTEWKRQWLHQDPRQSQPSPLHRHTHMKVEIGNSMQSAPGHKS